MQKEKDKKIQKKKFSQINHPTTVKKTKISIDMKKQNTFGKVT